MVLFCSSNIKVIVHHKYDIGLKCPSNIPVHQYKIHFSKFMPESIPAKNVYSLLSSLASCAQLFVLSAQLSTLSHYRVMRWKLQFY